MGSKNCYDCNYIKDTCCDGVYGACCRKQNITAMTYIKNDRRFNKLVDLIASLEESERNTIENLLNFEEITFFAPVDKAWNVIPFDYLKQDNEESKLF